MEQRQETSREAAHRENEAEIDRIDESVKTRVDIERELERALKRESEK